MRLRIAQFLCLQLFLGIALSHYTGVGSAADTADRNRQVRTIAFRFDDVQDYWLSETQQAVVELFVREGLKLSLGVIGGNIGNDAGIVEVIRSNRDILSLANHGMHAKNAPDGRSLLLSQPVDDTRRDLLATENKILSVFGVATKTFIPHQNQFDEATLQILAGLGYTHISSACGKHSGLNFCMDECGDMTGGAACTTPDRFGLIHVPAGASFNWQPLVGSKIYPTGRILEEVANSLEHYCFAVVMLHPQDFATADETLDPQALESLRVLLGEIGSRAESLEVVWLEEIEPRCR